MAHETLTEPVPGVTWTSGSYVMPRAELEQLDAKQTRAINGDRGGAWAPSAPIEIGGFGVRVTGPVDVAGGGVLDVTSAGGIVLGDGDFQDLAEGHAGRTRQLRQDTSFPLGVGDFGGYPWAATVSPRHLAAQTVALSFVDSFGNERGSEFLIQLRVHHGATLDRLVFRFRVPYLRKSTPTTMPKLRVFRADRDGNVDVLKSTTLGDGYAGPENPGTSVAWHAGGAIQEFDYVCDQHNVIDTSQFIYWAHVVEETGATEFPEKMLVQNGVGFGSLAGLQATAAAESPPFDVDPVSLNGAIFQINPGADETSYKIYQAVIPSPYTGPGSIIFREAEPAGNVWGPFVAHFSGIETTGWQ